MGLGLALDLSYIKENFLQIVMVTTLFMSVKFGILLLMGNYKFKNWTSSLKLGVLLSQGGEFGLLIITSALGHKLITSQLAEMATACITLSLCVTPLLAKACDHFSMESLEVQPQQSNDEGEEIIANDNSKVIPLVKPESTSEVKEKTAA